MTSGDHVIVTMLTDDDELDDDIDDDEHPLA